MEESRYIEEKKDWISGEEESEYLCENKNIPINIVTRFGLGSENLSSRFWNGENERRCRLYKEELETLEDIFDRWIWTKGERKVKEVVRQEELDI